MAYNGPKQPLLSRLLDSTTPQTYQKKSPKRRRFLRGCKSTPSAENVPQELNGTGSLPLSESIFGKVPPIFRRVAIFLAVYLGLGTICFYLLRYQMKGKKTNGVLDAVYFCIVTMATVGYGDLVPNSLPTKLLACAFVLTGMALVGLILSKAADYLVEKQEILLVKALNMDQKDDPTTSLNEIKTIKVRNKCILDLILLLLLIIVGTIFLVLVEEMNLVDAFYCVCVSVTTLGYGDISFSTQSGRVFAVFWILSSTICLAQFFFYVAEVNAESKQGSMINRVLIRKMTKADLEAADLDDDGVAGEAEFIIYKLKEMGKISEEDISLVMDRFEHLDVDRTGTLSTSDIMLAQSSETGK